MAKKKQHSKTTASDASIKEKKKKIYESLSPEEKAVLWEKRQARIKEKERDKKKEQKREAVLKHRKKVRRNKRLKKLFSPGKIVLFLLVIGAIAGIVFLVNTTMFNIKNIEVEGENLASKESIISKSGLEEGQNMFSFSAAGAQTSIEKIIFIKKARIDRKYPDTIIIKIEERTPEYILESGGSYYEVDSDGVLLLKSDTLLRYDVPLVTGINLKKAKIGNQIYEKNDNKLRTVNSVFSFLSENELMGDISQFYINKKGRYYLYLKNGSILEFANFKAFDSHSDFIKYFIKNEDSKVKVELIEEVNPIYKKVK